MAKIIQVNKKEYIDKMVDNHDDMNYSRNGEWQIHVQPHRPNRGLIVYHQSGNYYPPEIARKIDEFDLDEFVNWKGADMDSSGLFDFNGARDDARKDFKNEHDINDEVDLEFELDEKMKVAWDKMEREYLDNAIQFAEETVSSNLLDIIPAEENREEYKIEWV